MNATINSICSNCYEVARQQALEVNQILEQDDIPDEYSEENAPFLGVPLSVKEAFALTGKIFILKKLHQLNSLKCYCKLCLCIGCVYAYMYIVII